MNISFLRMDLIAKVAIPVAVVLAVIAVSPLPARGNDSIPGRYIIVLKDSGSDVDGARDSILRRAGGVLDQTYRHAVRGFAGEFSPAQIAQIRNDPRVAFVSEDRLVSVADAPEARSAARSSRGGSKTPPPPPPQATPTGIDRIDAEHLSNTGSGVEVAVIDTGIDTSHPDLAGQVLGGVNCSSDRRGGYADQNGHGTHVSGTIAALDNTQGVVGVAPGAKLWAVRVLDRNGNGTWSSVICGIDFVTAHAPANGGNITVANMSLGGSGSSDDACGANDGDALHAAICKARDAGVTFAVAAGNNGANAGGFVPAAYDDAVITVSALADSDGAAGGLGAGTAYGTDDTFASFSNYGTVVDIGAPGVNIYSTWTGGGYNTISGTSMATPHVAGAIALYLASHPGMSWTAVRDALASAGEALGAGHTDSSGLHSEPVLKADTL